MSRNDFDMSDAFIEDALESFTVERRKQSVNEHGRGTTLVDTTEAFGNINNAGPNDLLRLPEQQRMGKVLSVVTQFRLRGPSGTDFQYQPDQIIVNGDRFVVTTLEDYSAYGSGFIQALCSSIQPEDKPPTPATPAFGFGDGEGVAGFGEGVWAGP